MSQHQEYPKYLSHPSYDPGTVGTEVRSPSGFAYFTGGKPARFPPVVVRNEDDEAYHKAVGYVDSGKSDPAAFARSLAVAPPAANYSPVEYPKWIGEVLVANVEEEAALAQSGEPDYPEPAEPGRTPFAPPEEDDLAQLNNLEAQHHGDAS